MSMYDKLDNAIMKAIRFQNSPLYDREVNLHADEISKETERKAFRIIDLRLQALRKAGRIVFLKKKDSPRYHGWRINSD